MSASTCLRCCLVRPAPALSAASLPIRTATPLHQLRPAIQQVATFSTTPAAAKAAPKGNDPESSLKGHIRAGKRLVLRKFKKKNLDRGKPPLPGERKAYRKRIILSNDNALPVPWVTEMGPEDLLKKQNEAKVLSLPDDVVDQLRAIEAFKPTQNWKMFRKPSVLVRKETVDLVNRMQNAAGNRQTLKLVVTGDKVSGKSLLILEAQAHAFMNEWIVIHLPEGQDLTNAHTEYAPIPNTNPTQYMQPTYIMKLLQNIKKANEKVLMKLTTVTTHPELPQNITPGTPLITLAGACKEADYAWATFMAFWKELTHPAAQGRPPILFSLDGLAHIMRLSEYRSPAFELIHSHDLALVRLFVDCLSGHTPLPHGGAVLASTSGNNAPKTPSLDLALAQRLAEQAGKPAAEIPKRDPYFRGYDDRVEHALRNVQVLPLRGVSKLEARALMEYWAASGMYKEVVDERAVAAKWALAGSGLVGEMERAALLTMRM